MATSSVANLFAFFTASKPRLQPPSAPLKLPPPHLSTAAATALASSSRAISGRASLVLSNEAQSSPYCSSDVMSVVCPSVAYAKTMCFSSYNVQVVVDENEPEDQVLGRFRREVMRAGIIQECRRRRFYEDKQDKKKRKAREAAMRNRLRRRHLRGEFQDREEIPENKEEDEDEDNWDLPEGDLPY